MGTSYRLPEQLGGGVFVGAYAGYAAGRHSYQGHIEGFGGANLDLAHRLEEINPPSIDDPMRLPINLYDSVHDASLGLEGDGLKTRLRIRVRGEHISRAGGVFDYSDSTLDLQPADLRDLARAAWQRANAIEAGS